MAGTLLFAIGLIVAAFVGTNVGGSSTGVAFGPATGSGVLSMRRASALMAVFVLLGGFTVGTRVVDTLGTEFVPPRRFTLAASIGILLFTGLGVLFGNVLRVSVSTSETAVGAVVGMGAALGVLDWSTVGAVVTWWFVSAVVAFWLAAVVGRYLYDRIVDALALDGEPRATVGKVALVGVGCYMAFAAGASNVANAVAPLVGSGVLAMTPGIALGGLAIGVGAFALGARTMETVGDGITDLTVEAALVVEVISATIITGLSWARVPASLAVTATMCVIGLGWGRATKQLSDPASASPDAPASNDEPLDLFRPRVAKRIVATWFATPLLAGLLSFLVFLTAARLGLL